jgi:hypothetical protein
MLLNRWSQDEQKCLVLKSFAIVDNATTIIHVCAESAHKAHLDYYTSYEAAKHGAAKFLRNKVEKVWYGTTASRMQTPSTRT